MDNEPNFEIRKLDVLASINEDFQIIINEKLKDFISILQEYRSDILFMSEKYYQQTRIKEKYFWVNLDINSDITFAINKKGLIYEVQDEN